MKLPGIGVVRRLQEHSYSSIPAGVYIRCGSEPRQDRSGNPEIFHDSCEFPFSGYDPVKTSHIVNAR